MLKKIRQSLITRLMFYFLLAGFVMVALFSMNIAFGLKVHFKNEILPNIAQYMIYIKDDIGLPPNIHRARQLSEQLSIQVLIKGPGINWHSNDKMSEVQGLQFEVAPQPYQQFKIAHQHEHNFVLLEESGYQYYFSLKTFSGSPSFKRNLGLFVVFMLFMVVLFFAIRKSLSPLHDIKQGVKKLAQGDLDSKIIVHNSFEFEQLANGINNMAEEINGMLEAKQQLLLAISHELRSPLTRAQVNLALLAESDSQKALKYDLVEMELLISQILESQRLNQKHSVLNKTQFQFDVLIQHVIKTYFAQEELDLELTSISIVADYTRVMLLVKNLIDNALKYSKQTTKVPVIRLMKRNNEVICEVQDYGIGMKGIELNKITQAFYRIDEARQRSTGGFGLGLYLCHLIVQAHNARMTFESEEGRGTRVIVIFSLV